MLYLSLFIEFFKTGLFAVGGGLATLPFLYEMSANTGWFTTQDISNMIAVSESTPGPMGVNMATYVGYIIGGIPGCLIATLGLITPSILVILAVSRILQQFKDNKYVNYAFYGLRAASTALIAVAFCGIARLAFLSSSFSFAAIGPDSVQWFAFALAVIVFFAFRKFKPHPILCIVISAAAGILLGM